MRCSGIIERGGAFYAYGDITADDFHATDEPGKKGFGAADEWLAREEVYMMYVSFLSPDKVLNGKTDL